MKTPEELATEYAVFKSPPKPCPACGEETLWSIDRDAWLAGFNAAVEMAREPQIEQSTCFQRRRDEA